MDDSREALNARGRTPWTAPTITEPKLEWDEPKLLRTPARDALVDVAGANNDGILFS